MSRFSILFATLLLSIATAQICHRAEDSYIGDLCYTFSNQQLTWQNARDYCNVRSLNLGVLHTTLQANFLASEIRTKVGDSNALFWIGLSRASLGSRFQWDDGTPMVWNNFDGNFPKDNLNVAESVVNGKWRTLNGAELHYFVCSYDPRSMTPGTDQPTTSGYTTSEGSTISGSTTSTGSSSTMGSTVSTVSTVSTTPCLETPRTPCSTTPWPTDSTPSTAQSSTTDSTISDSTQTSTTPWPSTLSASTESSTLSTSTLSTSTMTTSPPS